MGVCRHGQGYHAKIWENWKSKFNLNAAGIALVPTEPIFNTLMEGKANVWILFTRQGAVKQQKDLARQVGLVSSDSMVRRAGEFLKTACVEQLPLVQLLLHWYVFCRSVAEQIKNAGCKRAWRRGRARGGAVAARQASSRLLGLPLPL